MQLSMLLALWATGDALAGGAQAAKPEMKLKLPEYQLSTQDFRFPSGLRILFQADSSHPVVTAWMLVDHGSADDPTGKEETAHFVEHMWFRSKHGDRPPIMTHVQELGARFNATTRNDWTDYRTVVPAEQLDELLTLESLRLTDFYRGVTEEEIDVEREVIRNEWRRRNEQNTALFVNFLSEAIYPKSHPYHSSSTHETIDNIKLADLQAYVDEYYRPDTTTLLVVGDFDPAEASSLIYKNIAPELLHPDLTPEMQFTYGKPGIENPDPTNEDHIRYAYWAPETYNAEERTVFSPLSDDIPVKRRVSLTDVPQVPELGSTEVLTRQGPFDNKTVVVGWSMPGGYRADHFELSITGNLLHQQVAPAFADLQKREQVGDVGCGSFTERLSTTVFCYVELKDEDLDPLRERDRLLDQVSDMWNPENFTPNTIRGQVFRSFFQRGKMEALADTLLSLDLFAAEMGGRGELIAPHAHLTGSAMAHSDGMTMTMTVEPKHITERASKYLLRNRAATVIIEPLDEEDIDVGSESSSYAGADATDQVVDTKTDLTEAKVAASYVKPDLDELQDFQLDNGLRVVVLPHGEAPLVQVSLLVRRNSIDAPRGAYEFARRFTVSTGVDPLPVAARTNFPIVPAFAGQSGWGLPLNGQSWNDGVRLDYTAPSGNLDAALWMLREEIETARPYVDGKTQYIKAWRDGLKRDWSSRASHIRRLTMDHLYPEVSGYASTTWEDIDRMESWGASDVQRWLDSHLRPDNATLLIVGNIEPNEARDLAQAHFGGWSTTRGQAPAPMSSPPMPRAEAKIFLFDDPKRTQSNVGATCRLDVTTPEQDAAVQLISSVVRERTFRTLRVQEGLAYSPGAYANVGADRAGTLGFYSLATNAGVGRTVQFFHEQAESVASGGVSPDEVLTHKMRIARAAGVSSQSVAQMIGRLTGVVRRGGEFNEISDYGQTIAAVASDELGELLKSCSDHLITTIEGPKAVIAPQLDELGYEYEVYEWSAYGSELLWEHDPKAAKKKEKKKQKDARKAAREKAKEDKSGEGSASAD